jgi:hypothetical protein
MNPYLTQQNKLQAKQRTAFLFLAAGAALGFIFPPAVVISIYGIVIYWQNTWKIHTAKCPVCEQKVGMVRLYSNEKCRHCGEVFIQSVVPKSQSGQDQWLK